MPEVEESKLALIKKSFLTLASIEVLGCVVNSLNSAIDTVFIGGFLETEAMAAVGFFSPLLTIISLVWVIIIGLQIICGQYIGDGDKENLQAMFSTAVVFLGVLSIGASIFCYVKCDWLAYLLGAQERVHILLQEYIKGYSLGFIGNVYCSLLMWFLAFNYDIKLSRLIVILMVILNLVGNMFFVAILEWGIFGLGLASAISYLICATVMLQRFFNEDKLIRLTFKKFYFLRLLKSARHGASSITFNLGLTIKSYLLNITLMTYIGTAAVAVMNVQGTIIGLLGAIPVGFGNAFLALGSVWYNSKDKQGLMMLTRLMLKYTLLFSTVIMLFIMLSSSLVPSLFFSQGEEAWFLAKNMLLLFPSFIVLNSVMMILLKSYQFQKKNEFLVNFMPIIENILIAILAIQLTPIGGINAVWLSFPFAEILWLLIITFFIFRQKKHMPLNIWDWLAFEEIFGVDKSNYMERTFSTLDDVVLISLETIEFCKQHGFARRKAYFAGLAIEELAINIVKYGFNVEKKYNAYVRVTATDKIYIRIYDNSSDFNLKQKLQDIVGNYPEEKNISLRIVEQILKNIDYQNNAGINTLVLVV